MLRTLTKMTISRYFIILIMFFSLFLSCAGDKPDPSAKQYIGNINTKKFHKPDCSYLLARQNQVTLESRDQAIELGYSACGIERRRKQN
ncbi:MAG: hypothetical protein GY839_03155 [candidate division Zixibacteria bacterium]|nr:hypothetical protein [candidate division Zixibacteria bacterium]